MISKNMISVMMIFSLAMHLEAGKSSSPLNDSPGGGVQAPLEHVLMQGAVCRKGTTQIEPPLIDLYPAHFLLLWNSMRLKDIGIIDMEIRRDEEGEYLFSGVFRSGVSDNVLKIGQSDFDFVAELPMQAYLGRKLVDFDIIEYDDTVGFRMSGSWVAGVAVQELELHLDWNNFLATNDIKVRNGLNLVDVEVVEWDGELLYSGLWEAGAPIALVERDTSFDDFHNRYHDLNKNKWRLEDMETTKIDDTKHYVGLWIDSCEPDRLFIGSDVYGPYEDVDSLKNTYANWAWMIDFEHVIEVKDYQVQHDGEPVLHQCTDDEYGVGDVSKITQLAMDELAYELEFPIGATMPIHSAGSSGPGN